jgi:hypothetical protein
MWDYVRIARKLIRATERNDLSLSLKPPSHPISQPMPAKSDDINTVRRSSYLLYHQSSTATVVNPSVEASAGPLSLPEPLTHIHYAPPPTTPTPSCSSSAPVAP